MNYRNDSPRDPRDKRLWGLISLAGLAVFPPAGVALIAANALGLLPHLASRADMRQVIDRANADIWQLSTLPKRSSPGLPQGGGFLAVVGWILAAVGLFASLGFGLGMLFRAWDIWDLLRFFCTLSVFSLGTVLAIYGMSRNRKRKRYEAYLKLVGDKTAISIHYLADVLGTDYKKVIKDLKEMICRGIFQPAWLDMKTYRLMLTEYTPEEEETQAPQEQREEYISRSARILRQIRADNDLIDDEEVSRKIDRIEDLTRKIFAILDKYPEKEPQLYRFLNYYLPTTLKALESYARLEAQGIETASIRETKAKINHMLDELADGYEKQLDKLFENEYVDITADIEVMRQMLQKDGLSEDEITKK